jgi:hypothetical protein
VYLGTSFDDVNTAVPGTVTATSIYRGAFDTNTYDVLSRYGPLAFKTVYYWRIDEVNVGTAGSPWRGATWNFSTVSGKARNPYPRNNSNDAYDVNNKLYMRWTKGQMVASTNGHRVFFGTDYNEVNDATTTTPTIYRGLRTDANYPLSALWPTPDHNLTPDYTLVPDANYYWRVDEVNEANGLSPWIGDVWHHVFPNNYIVEDFNRYTSSADMCSVWKMNLLTNSGCPTCSVCAPGGNPQLDLANGAMTLDYNNTGGFAQAFSETRYTGPTAGLDLTVPGVPSGPVKLLHISYNGLATNSADPIYDRMYVMIADANTPKSNFGPVYYNPDPTAQQKTSWTDCYIKLTDLNTPNVNLKKIKYLFIGLGLRCNPYQSSTPGGSGQVKFDDIWVTQPICNPRYGPAADFTGDCFVDTTDVDIFVNDWLLSDTTLSYPDACAPSKDPVLWYQFEESGDTNTAVNSGSSGATYNGTVINRNAETWDANGRIGRCIRLVYGRNSYVNVPAAVLAPFADVTGPNGITFTFWLNADSNYPPPSEWPAIFSASTTGASPGVEVIEIECPTAETPPTIHAVISQTLSGGNNMRAGDFGGRWNHYAVVKDADTNTMSIYENGAQIASLTREDINKPLLSAVPLIFKIGERYGWDPSMVARIDDVRMYDYALDANEIAYIATNGDVTKSIFVPLAEPTNLKPGSSPEVVNFGDFALFANQWLTEKLWP